MPLVSVIIPTYNSAQYVTAAVESVLGHSVTDVEILVIDDGSTDATRSVLASYGAPVRYLYQPNGGVAVARNRGIAESVGRYVAFLDADDTWFPEKLERQLTALRQAPGVGFCYAGYRSVDDEMRPLKEYRPRPRRAALEDLLFYGNFIGSICTVVAEKALFDRVGGFDPELSQCADWDMWVRLARQTEFLAIEEPLVTYRQHATNMSRNTPLLERDSNRVLEKAFADPGTPEHLRARAGRAWARNWMKLAGCYFHASLYRDFARCATRALKMDPAQSTRLIGYPFRRLSRAAGLRTS
jgi:glycosyltransferase involved in cell wall biosynthesis